MADIAPVSTLLALFKGLSAIHRATLLITVVFVVLIWTQPGVANQNQTPSLPFQIVIWAWPCSVGICFIWDLVGAISVWLAGRKEMKAGAPILRETPPGQEKNHASNNPP